MAKKKPSFSKELNISVPLNCWLTAIVESITINKMTTISSTIRIPKTTFANFFRFSPNSSNALIIIVVEELANNPPRKILSIVDQFIHRPTKYPTTTIQIISTIAVMEAEPPTLSNFLKLNSNPRLKRRKITPIFAQISTLCSSATDGI